MLIEAQGLVKTYPTPDGALTVLDGVSLALAAGETLALTGESGSGKSTLLHLLSALDTPDAGEVVLDGTPISGLGDSARAALRRRAIGLVFQQFSLVPSLTAGENLSFQARLAGRYDPKWAEELIARLGLGPVLARYPEELSGGQQQRVALGRALAARPPVILADEPTGNLDEENAARAMEAMLSLVSEAGAGLLVVTHSEQLAARLSRRLHLSRGRLAPAPAAPVAALPPDAAE